MSTASHSSDVGVRYEITTTGTAEGRGVTVGLHGDLDRPAARQMDEIFTYALGGDAVAMLINLIDVDFCTMEAAEALWSVVRRCRPREAEYLLALVRDDILRPVARGPANLPHFTGQDDLLARGLIEVHGEDDQIAQWPTTWQAPTADLLFGLGLLATPTR